MEQTEKIKRVVREWMERVRGIHRIGVSSTSDWHIDCPKCDVPRGMDFDHDKKHWRCLWRDCQFTFPRGFEPPSLQEFEAYLDRKALDKRIEMFLDSE
jgi:hypothetical protein